MGNTIQVVDISRRLNSYDFAVQLPVKGTSQVIFNKDQGPRAKALITGFLMGQGLSYEESLNKADRLLAPVICQLHK